MSRDPALLLDDMIRACEKIGRYLGCRSRESFESDEQAFDATLIGEAAKRLPASIKDARPEVVWRDIAGLRDIIVHEYFGLDRDIIWDVAHRRVPELLVHLRALAR